MAIQSYDDDDEVLTPKDVQKMLRLGKTEVNKLFNSGEIEDAFRVGTERKLWRAYKWAVRKYQEKGKHRPTRYD